MAATRYVTLCFGLALTILTKVEIFQSVLFWYCCSIIAPVLAFAMCGDLKKFFFFSELTWLCLFMSSLCANLTIGSAELYSCCFFILVFTACEAVVLAAILLVSTSENEGRLQFSVKLFDFSLFFVFQNVFILMMVF